MRVLHNQYALFHSTERHFGVLIDTVDIVRVTVPQRQNRARWSGPAGLTAGVQHTIFAMGEAVLGAVPLIAEVSLTMPNQHRILANLEPFGLSNANEVFVNTSEPYGLIKGTVGR